MQLCHLYYGQKCVIIILDEWSMLETHVSLLLLHAKIYTDMNEVKTCAPAMHVLKAGEHDVQFTSGLRFLFDLIAFQFHNRPNMFIKDTFMMFNWVFDMAIIEDGAIIVPSAACLLQQAYLWCFSHKLNLICVDSIGDAEPHFHMVYSMHFLNCCAQLGLLQA